ncbi:beta-glucosidase family protein [Sphingomonas nostoxanthinifaciens]|uniref:beta-glucosidase family protein n=1 Tax=Sphingomonas nostoxanthinifaciens TaxID=2872652 RepID=UPI001CC20AC6|nr:beta-glucosidase [Sphingomonas nostoxanthinifaciens]UAK25806.1 beta-glucosidase [Sphingomonas nostoxanthinifaciens]
MFRFRRTLWLLGASLLTAPLAAQTAADRAATLVAKMTQAEKLQLVHGWWYPPTGAPTPGMPDGWVPSAGYVPGIARLGIPALRESDASLGVANQVEERKGDTATALPSALATAASFDPAIARAGGAMIGAEARAKRFNVLLAGGVNLTRDPWGGRDFEYMGEDPLLAGRMAGAAIAGVQSNHIVSTVKHFVLNPQETGRNVYDARLAEAPLRESDLLAFQIAIADGAPGSVMCAYNLQNGAHACENGFNLTTVLKQDWHYPGWVMSDWGAVHSTIPSALGGLDQESGQQLDAQVFFGKPLEDALARGQVPQSRLDDMVKRILTGMIETGTMDDPLPDAATPIDFAAHADVAQRAAEAGIVLLKNEGNLLPVMGDARRIVLIGAHADVGVLSGGGSSQVRSVGGVPVEIPLARGEAASFARMTWHASSPLHAIRALTPNARVDYIDGSDPAAAAKAAVGADMVIVFAWQWQTEAQDAETLALPDNQDALIAAVARANRRTAVVLETGGPVLMPWLQHVPAVIEAWYPGQRGGEAIANILFGRTEPSGRLPITFPAAETQAPRPKPVGLDLLHARDRTDPNGPIPHFTIDYPEGANVGYRWYQIRDQRPLFAFGHGLSYTRFTYSQLTVQGANVRFTVANIGKRSGTDVPQVYVEAPDSAGVKSYRLAAWQRVTLKPGEAKTISVTVDPRAVAAWNSGAKRWTVPSAALPLVVGHEAADRALAGRIRVDAPVVN